MKEAEPLISSICVCSTITEPSARLAEPLKLILSPRLRTFTLASLTIPPRISTPAGMVSLGIKGNTLAIFTVSALRLMICLLSITFAATFTLESKACTFTSAFILKYSSRLREAFILSTSKSLSLIFVDISSTLTSASILL